MSDEPKKAIELATTGIHICESSHRPRDTACRDFERGVNGRCVYCDHEDKCHPGPGATCEIGRTAFDREIFDRKERSRAKDRQDIAEGRATAAEVNARNSIATGLAGHYRVKGELGVSDLNKCPNCGGPADNGHDREYPPNPYWCSKCSTQEEG